MYRLVFPSEMQLLWLLLCMIELQLTFLGGTENCDFRQ